MRQLPAYHVTAAKVTGVDPAKFGCSQYWLLLSNNFEDNATIAQELFWKGWQVQQANDWNGPIFLIRRR